MVCACSTRHASPLVVGGEELAILAYGFPANHALEARQLLASEGHSVAVYDAVSGRIMSASVDIAP